MVLDAGKKYLSVPVHEGNVPEEVDKVGKYFSRRVCRLALVASGVSADQTFLVAASLRRLRGVESRR